MRPGHVSFDAAFRVGRGTGKPALVSFNCAFRLTSFGFPRVIDIPVDFEVSAPLPSIFVFDEDWEPIAQRVMLDTGWFPEVT